MKRKQFLKPLLITFFFFFGGTAFAQWQQLNGPLGGYVRSILYDGNTVFAATGGGVLVCDNQGSSWSFRNKGLISCDTKSLTKLGDYVFVSTDENVFRTNDNGVTWEPTGTELEGKYIKHLIESNKVLIYL